LPIAWCLGPGLLAVLVLVLVLLVLVLVLSCSAFRVETRKAHRI
jgi:hypothetical protein